MLEERGSSGARLAQSAGLFGAVLEAIDQPVVLTTTELAAPGPAIVYSNPAFSRLTGYDRDMLIGRSPRFLQGPATDRDVLDQLRSTLERGVSYWGSAVNYRADGSAYCVEWLIAPVHDRSGHLTHWAAIQNDVTDLRGTEAALKPARRHVQAVEPQVQPTLAEMQHRLRSTLAVVRALALGTGETTESVEHYTMHLDGRLGAFSRVQNAVMRSSETGVDLYGLVADELLSVVVHDSERAHLSGPAVFLRPKAAELLTLAIHELTVNAIKFGALAGERGRLSVRWWVEGEGGEHAPILVIDWLEAGPGTGVSAPRHRGFGLSLLEQTLPRELAAEVTVTFAPDGLACRILLPLTEQIRTTAQARPPISARSIL